MTEARGAGVIRLEREGPPGVGLAPMVLDAADFQSDLPDQRIHVYFEDPARGLTVGVWTTTEMQEAFGPYPGDEFMLVLEGRVLMTDGEGGAVPVETGQSFVVRNGVPVSWRQVGPCRKFFILLRDPAVPTPRIASAEGGVIVSDPAALERRLVAEPDSIGGGSQRDAEIFTNDAGTFTVGMWETTAFETEEKAFGYHEYAQILAGTVDVIEAGGGVHRFGPGDVFFVPKGTRCRWRAPRGFRKYYAIVEDPA